MEYQYFIVVWITGNTNGRFRILMQSREVNNNKTLKKKLLRNTLFSYVQ